MAVAVLLAATLLLLPMLATSQGTVVTIGDGDIDIDTNEAAALGFRQDGGRGKPSGALTLDAWGVGIRKGGRVINECGAIKGGDIGGENPAFLNLEFDRVRGKNGGKTFDSRVLCGKSKAVRVRHQLRTARRRKGCKGAYEIKVTVENRSCGSVHSVLYRRVTGVNLVGDGVPDALLSIQGINAKQPKVDIASSDQFCDPVPPGPCGSGDISVPASRALPGDSDLGSAFQLDLGRLKKGQRATFYMYYGAFSSPSKAKACVKGARMVAHTLVTNSDTEGTVVFGIRHSLSKGGFKNKKKCVKL